jgi:LuxR family maltose regulon positive regulatory protein
MLGSEASVPETSFALVETKLAAPKVRAGTVVKTEVIRRLRTSGAHVATVVAPAGYGKTTLLAHWARVDPRPFAWVALDGRDDAGLMFLRYVAAALHRVEPLGPEVFDALSGPGASIWSTGVPRLGTALAGLRRPLVLVLDDLHTVQDPTSIDVLTELINCIPAESQIAVASREQPGLPLARWRAQGRLHEIGMVDLRLDEPEAEALLREAGVDPGPDQVSALTERTEGWPAGLYLAALSLQVGAPRPARVETFGGEDRFVSEYFHSELLSRLPENEARFLLHTSVLDRMCGVLCDAVLQTTWSGRRLQELERLNRFLVPLDRRGEWYRYHHLFGELLRNELGRSQPGIVAELNRRAMAWCIANDLPEDAIGYGQAAGETTTVASLVDRLAMPLYFDGRMATLEEWLDWFDPADLVRFPSLVVDGAWIRALTGRPEEAEWWLSLAEGAISEIPLSDGSSTIDPWVANLRAFMMPNGPEQALADADLALAQFAPQSVRRASALLMRGIANMLLGHLDRARDDLTATVDLGIALDAPDDVFVAQAQLALLAMRRGAWDDAGRYARQAQDLVDKNALSHYTASAIAHVATARVALREGRQADTRAALARTHRLRPLLDRGMPRTTVQVGLELTRIHLALHETEAARTVLSETERVLARRPSLGSLADDALELRERVIAATSSAGALAMTLTTAELRLLPYLATHLTFPEIARTLSVSYNTVRTEAASVYRKLGGSSRSEAIRRAVMLGLLEEPHLPALTGTALIPR